MAWLQGTPRMGIMHSLGCGIESRLKCPLRSRWVFLGFGHSLKTRRFRIPRAVTSKTSMQTV